MNPVQQTALDTTVVVFSVGCFIASVCFAVWARDALQKVRAIARDIDAKLTELEEAKADA